MDSELLPAGRSVPGARRNSGCRLAPLPAESLPLCGYCGFLPDTTRPHAGRARNLFRRQEWLIFYTAVTYYGHGALRLHRVFDGLVKEGEHLAGSKMSFQLFQVPLNIVCEPRLRSSGCVPCQPEHRRLTL